MNKFLARSPRIFVERIIKFLEMFFPVQYHTHFSKLKKKSLLYAFGRVCRANRLNAHLFCGKSNAALFRLLST